MRKPALLLLLGVHSLSGLLYSSAPTQLSRRQVAFSIASVGLLQAPSARADEKEDCRRDCFRECNSVAPGNPGYCAAQCDGYCDEAGMTGKMDVLRSDPSDATQKNDLNKDLGIFGDSGVSYSKGVEDFFATAFGATRQSKNVNKADVGDFASDVLSAAKAAAVGKN
uniref:Uncharacterized protein n=1 Tax=Calcidiscus leptoporus TaxID=127549 RepID=A0A7S0ITZ2_9EUKA|mmetsp:Transcript_22519/g.51886  ORF Transcript_22519/g.51886 Transcript_22519/m.51886 type:complete len:167 (+) Transcript_22519:200-700(+)